MLRLDPRGSKERNAIARQIAFRYLGRMDLLTYIADMPRRVALAEALNSSPDYLNQLARKWRGKLPSPDFARAIERETERLGPEVVPKESLRPDLWGPADEPVAAVAQRA